MILLTNGEAIYDISSKSSMGLNVICMKILVCIFEYLVVFGKISCAYAFGFTMIELVIQGAKPAIGRLRPNFFDVCKPDFTKIDCDKG
jgi:hypothetical protein